MRKSIFKKTSVSVVLRQILPATPCPQPIGKCVQRVHGRKCKKKIGPTEPVSISTVHSDSTEYCAIRTFSPLSKPFSADDRNLVKNAQRAPYQYALAVAYPPWRYFLRLSNLMPPRAIVALLQDPLAGGRPGYAKAPTTTTSSATDYAQGQFRAAMDKWTNEKKLEF